MEVNRTHVTADLSAYLDGELSPAEQASVSTHLEGCRTCSGQLAELRATATVISALPEARPSRSLVPQVGSRWNWLRPVRSLSAVMSGAFVMVFLITAVAQSGSNLGGGPAMPFGRSTADQAQPASAPGAAGAAAQATQAPPVGALGSEPPPEAAAATVIPSPEPQPFSAEDTTKREDLERATATQDGRGAALTTEAPTQPVSPLAWLGLALVLAIVAGTAHWRLRAA